MGIVVVGTGIFMLVLLWIQMCMKKFLFLRCQRDPFSGKEEEKKTQNSDRNRYLIPLKKCKSITRLIIFDRTFSVCIVSYAFFPSANSMTFFESFIYRYV